MALTTTWNSGEVYMFARFKLIVLLIAILALTSSCGFEPSQEYTIKYVIFYPNHNDTVTAKSNLGFNWGGGHGSNYVNGYNYGAGMFKSVYTEYSGSSPVKVLSYTSRELPKKQQN